jgi:peptidoglycan hydrolase CwlO-like protein
MEATVTMTYAQLERTTEEIKSYKKQIEQLEKESKKVRLEIYVNNDRNRLEASAQYFKNYGNTLPYNMRLEENGTVYVNFEDVVSELATKERQNVVKELADKDTQIYTLETKIKTNDEKHIKELRKVFEKEQELNKQIELYKEKIQELTTTPEIFQLKERNNELALTISKRDSDIETYTKTIEKLKNRSFWDYLFNLNN